MLYEDELLRAEDEDGSSNSTYIAPKVYYPGYWLMSSFAQGKFALAISDRSGMAFPYNEMVREWNGALVHVTQSTSLNSRN